jgi:hypothetical protein
MAAATSIGIPLGSEYTFSEFTSSNTTSNENSYYYYEDDGAAGAARPVSSVGGFGLSSLVVSARSGVIVGAQSAPGGASVTVTAAGSGTGSAPFLIAATFDPAKAHVPVLFGDVYLRVEGGAVTAYAADGPRASIQVDGDEVFAAFCDFGNGERPGALVVRTRSTMSIQRADPTRCTVPRGPFIVPIEQGADVWVFYGNAETIETDTAGIQNSVLSEVATLAAREAATGARPSSLDRSVYGLMDTGASLYGPATVVEPKFYTAPTVDQFGYGSGSGSGLSGLSGSGYGTGSGLRTAGLVTPGLSGVYGSWTGTGTTSASNKNSTNSNTSTNSTNSTGETWPRVWSSRESQF